MVNIAAAKSTNTYRLNQTVCAFATASMGDRLERVSDIIVTAFVVGMSVLYVVVMLLAWNDYLKIHRQEQERAKCTTNRPRDCDTGEEGNQ
jgi:hypothetical protein